MLLPNAERASVDRAKITDYLLSLSHPDGSSKAAFLMRFGFKTEEGETLAAALKEVGTSNPVTDSVESPHGRATLWTGRCDPLMDGLRGCAPCGSSIQETRRDSSRHIRCRE